jgi:hypothetical protein
MKIEKIHITNFIGARNFSLDDLPPVLLITGPNGAGKSSVIEAIRFALTGQVPRVELKRDQAALVSAGQKSGKVSVTMDGDEYTRDVKTGAGSGDAGGALIFTLDAAKMASLEPKERRAALFGLTGASFSAAKVVDELMARGHPMNNVDRIAPLLRSGFDAAAAEAKRMAAEARGGWKAITGEAYGAVKAETWTAPQSAPQDIGEAPNIEPLREAFEQAVRHHGALQAKAESARRMIDGVQKLKQRAARVEELRESLALLKARQQQQGTAPSDHGTLVGDCPHCGATLEILGGTLIECRDSLEVEVPHDPAIAGHIASLNKDLADAEQARAALAEADERPPVEPPSPIDLARSQDAIENARRVLAEAEARARAHAEALRLAESAGATTERAAELHAQVARWTELESDLSPNGLPAEILARALKPLNDSLRKVADASGWPLVQVGEDIAITAGGRVYGLLSESEQFRADAALAYAAAIIGGGAPVLLDRFDVLDIPGRGEFIGLACEMASKGVQTVAAGTLKAAPAGLPDGVASVWLGEK